MSRVMVSSMDILDETGRIDSRLDERLLNTDLLLHNGKKSNITPVSAKAADSNSQYLANGQPAVGSPTTTVLSPSLLAPLMDLRKLAAFVGVFYWLLLIALILPTACVATLFVFLYPTMLVSMSLFNRIEHKLCFMVNDVWVAACHAAGLRLTEYGDDITVYADQRCLCLANHLGLIDHFCLMTAFHDKKTLSGRYLWLIFNIWRFTTLGVMWTAHGNFFINGGATHRDRKLADFRRHLAVNYRKHDYGWVVMYPEGSRLYLIRDLEQTFCQRNDLTPFKHCAHPRSGAAYSALSVCADATAFADAPVDSDTDSSTAAPRGMPDGVRYIVDCTLGYPRGDVPALDRAMLGDWPTPAAHQLAVHYAVHRIEPAMVRDEAAFRCWLYAQYERKDHLLEDYYRTGRFPGVGRPVDFPRRRYWWSQAFWLALFYVHYRLWLRPLACLALAYVWSLVTGV